MWQQLRTIILADGVDATIDEYTESFEKFDESWLALEWLLARNPSPKGRLGKSVDDTLYFLYVQASDPAARNPEISVVYSHSDDEVTIHAIRATAFKGTEYQEEE